MLSVHSDKHELQAAKAAWLFKVQIHNVQKYKIQHDGNCRELSAASALRRPCLADSCTAAVTQSHSESRAKTAWKVLVVLKTFDRDSVN